MKTFNLVGIFSFATILLALSSCDDENPQNYRNEFVGNYEFQSHNFYFSVNPNHPDTTEIGYTYSKGKIDVQSGTSDGILIYFGDQLPVLTTMVSQDGILADTLIESECPQKFTNAFFKNDTVHFTLQRFPCSITQYFSVVSGWKSK